jgi:hypothetical protein
MKKNIIFYIAVIMAVGSSCNKYLNKTPDEDLTIDQVISDRRSADRFLVAAYSHLPVSIDFHEWFGRNPFVGASDEMEITWEIAFANEMNSGAWNPYNVDPNIWSTGWQGLRKVNIFLQNIGQSPIDTADKETMTGEAKFLRAIFLFFELRVYGAIPVYDKPLNVDDDFKTIERQPFDSCVNFIVKDCNDAAALLPLKRDPGEYGRASKAAALALKARVLLYAASPLFNGNPDYQGLKNKDGEKLYSAYDANKWEVAAQAAKDCIDQCEPTYQLYHSASNDPEANYKGIFENDWNEEVLFARNNDGHSSYSIVQEQCANPISLNGLSGYSPTQEMVDAYEMRNGQQPITGYDAQGNPMINPLSGYTEQGFAAQDDPNGYYKAGVSNMYVNRDPRFYATINFNGAIWKGHQIQFYNTGADGYASSDKVDYTKTGYLLRKFINPAVDIKSSVYVLTTWIYFRLGEQYLNYAEAINEAEGPAKAYTYVNAIRERAGMPDLPAGLSQDEMRDRIRHERQIELAFETERYFDCHRWKIAYKTDNTVIHGMNIKAGSSLQDPAFYQRTAVEKRVFEAPKHYLFPVPQQDIDKDPDLIQNPGW